jgi:hypothetical protein
MKLNFIFNTDKIEESVEIVSKFLPDLKRSGMYHYFPFTENDLQNTDAIQAQIARDIEQFHLDNTTRELQDYWEAHKEKINDALFAYLERENLSVSSPYICATTFYGPYGFYHTPDTIHLNITKGEIDFMIQTLLHEFLHLLLFERVRSLPENEGESVIDKTFVEIFGDLFPDYYVQ